MQVSFFIYKLKCYLLLIFYLISEEVALFIVHMEIEIKIIMFSVSPENCLLLSTQLNLHLNSDPFPLISPLFTGLFGQNECNQNMQENLCLAAIQ